MRLRPFHLLRAVTSKMTMVVFFFVIVTSFPLIAHATTYLPGVTLEPDCGPGTPDCGVSPIGNANSGTGAPSLPSPATGALYFDTTGGIFYAFNGTSWVAVGSGSTIASINGQTGASQTFVIGTSGTDVSINSSGNVHTLNIPSASALNRGVVTIGAQTFAGVKTFSSQVVAGSLGTADATGLNFVTNNATRFTLAANAATLTGTGSTTVASDAGSTLNLDSGTTGALNIGTGSNAKIITIGNTTGVTALNIVSGTGNINLAAAGTGVTGNVQIGAGGAGSATPDLLVLDTKSVASGTNDPDGTNGASYYNAASNKFRCYENGSWSDCIFQGNSSGENLTLARIGSSTFSSIQDLQNVFHSAGHLSGGLITDAGSGTINITAGTGLIRDSNTATAKVYYFDWAADNGVSIPSNTTRYIGVEYNSGSPQVSVRTSDNWNLKTDFPIGVVVNESGTLDISSDLQTVGDHAANMIQREYETMPLSRDQRDGGLMLSESGSRNIKVTAGAIWDRLNRYPTAAHDTSLSGNFDAYYRNASTGFVKVSAITQYPNTQYDNHSGALVDLTDNHYGVLWFYLDTDDEISMVYGRGDYANASLADEEMFPDTLPDRISVSGALIGKIIFQKSVSLAVSVASAFAMSFSSLSADHAALSDLDFATSGHTGFADALLGVNDNITSMTAITSLIPLSALTITAGGASTWSTSTGNLTIDSAGSLNLGTIGATAVSLGRSGMTTTNNGNMSVTGNFATKRGTDYTTTGSQNNVNLGTGSFIRYTGTSPATFTGIIAGTDGQMLTILNKSTSSALTLADNSGSSLAANRIRTGIGAPIVLPADSSVQLQYESAGADSEWHIISPPSNVASLASTALTQGGSSFGADALLGTSDFFGLNLITSGTTAFALDTSGNGVLTGGLTVNSGTIASPNATTLTIDSGTTGGLNLGTAGVSKAITLGNVTGTTSLDLKSGSGGIILTGNTSIAGSNTLSIGSGTFTASGNFVTPKGTNYSVTGSQNNVNFGTGFLFYFTGASPVTITGIAGGTDGRQIRITNISSSNVSLTNSDSASLIANRIITVSGSTETIRPNGSVTLQYDSASAFWRVTALPVEDIAFAQGGNAFAAPVTLGTTDANSLNFITNNATALTLSTAGDATLTGDLTVTGGDILSAATAALNITSGTSGVLTLDSGTTGAVNLGTGATAKIVTVGNTASTTALNLQSGTGNINLQSAGTGVIGDIQIGAGSGSATPDLFVLDLKNNDGTDPAGGINGASYYNTTLNKFRCYEGGGWKDCDTTGGTTTLQSAYNAGQTITTSSSQDFALTLTSGNFTASGIGAVNLTPTAASTFTSGGALTLTAGAASTWGTTAGNLSLQMAGTGTTANLQIGAGSTGSATPDLLVLDTKSAVSGSGDPSGTKGATYYNIASDKFRCFEGVAWKDCDTTAGTGLGTLNGQSGASQTLVVGTSGTDFNISSVTDVHTFNLPDASTTNRGVLTIGTQTIGGSKTFDNNLLVNGNTTLGDAAGDSLTVNAATLTLAGASTVVDMTGAGTLSLNTVTNRAITTGSGLFTTNGAATITGTFTQVGNYATPKGTDYSAPTGSQNNVNLGTGSLFRFTGASQTTFTGLAGGTDGRFIRITNASSVDLIFSNQDSASTDVNRIITSTGGNLTISADVSVGFQYDSGVSRWRTVVLPATSSTLANTVFVPGGNSFGSTTTLGTNDAFGLNLETNGVNAFTLDTSGNGTLTGDLTVTGGDINTPAATALVIDSGTTGALSFGTGSNVKTITIGNRTGATALNLLAGSGNFDLEAGTATFQTSTATNDKLAIVPHTGNAASFTGTITSADLSGTSKTWTFPNTTGNIMLDTSTCSSTGSFVCVTGNNTGSELSLGTTDAFALNLQTAGTNRFTIASGTATLTGNGATSITSSGAMTVDAATGLSLGTSTATSVSIGGTGVATTNNGSLTATQTLTASNGFTLTTGALNLTATSGTVDLHSTVIANGSPLVFDGTTANVNKTTFVITDPSGTRAITFPDASITVNAAGDMSGATLSSNVLTSSLTAVGALASGSITSGFGAISTTNNITTSSNISTTGSGTITSAGALTASNGFTLTTGALNLTATSGTLDLHSTVIANGSPLVFDGTTANANKTTFVITDPSGARTITFPDASVTINAAADISGATLSSGVLTSSLTTVGALNAGSITSGFGAIDTGADNITTTGTVSGNDFDRSTAGVLTFGNTNATSTSICNSAACDTITVGTNTDADTITIGDALDSLSLASTGLNLTTGGALTGVASVDTIAASATALTFAGAGTISSTTSSALTLDSGSTGDVNLGTGATAKSVTVGNVTGATSLNLKSGSGNILMTVDATSSSGKVQIGNSGTATPDLLVLDNGTADPAGTNGAMYYNSSTTKFRCYQNGAWANCIGGDKFWVPKSSDQTVTNSTTLASDSALTFAVGSGETWVFGFDLFVTNGNSNVPDFKAAILGASGWTCSVQMSGTESAGAIFPQATTTDCDNAPTAMVNNNINADASQGYTVHLQGTVTTSSAGSVTLQFAENTGGAGTSVTMKGGSFVEAFKVGGADLAELYHGDHALTPGTVVAIDPLASSTVMESTSAYGRDVIGVVTTNPGMVLGDTSGATGAPILVALAGRVPVNVSTENGPIAIGDYLTSSSTPGVAMKATVAGNVIGQALSSYDGVDVGQVLLFVKNTFMPADASLPDAHLLLGDVSPSVNADGSDNGLSALITTIQSENAHDPIVIIGDKIENHVQFLTDFVAARVTAIRGYFDEVFAKKVHTDQICVKKSDGSEVCIDGDQLERVMDGQATVVPTASASLGTGSSTPSPAPSIEDTSVPSDDSVAPMEDPSVVEEAPVVEDAVPADDSTVTDSGSTTDVSTSEEATEPASEPASASEPAPEVAPTPEAAPASAPAENL